MLTPAVGRALRVGPVHSGACRLPRPPPWVHSFPTALRSQGDPAAEAVPRSKWRMIRSLDACNGCALKRAVSRARSDCDGAAVANAPLPSFPCRLAASPSLRDRCTRRVRASLVAHRDERRRMRCTRRDQCSSFTPAASTGTRNGSTPTSARSSRDVAAQSPGSEASGQCSTPLRSRTGSSAGIHSPVSSAHHPPPRHRCTSQMTPDSGTP